MRPDLRTFDLLSAAMRSILERPGASLPAVAPAALLIISGWSLLNLIDQVWTQLDVTPTIADLTYFERLVVGTFAIEVTAFSLLIIGMPWFAIAWHRFVLSPAGQISVRLILRYVGKAAPISIMVFLGALLIYLPFLTRETWPAALSFGLAPVYYLTLRLSLVLPAAAAGTPLAYTAAWRTSRAARGACFGLSLTLCSLDFLLVILEPALGSPLVSTLFLVALGGFWTAIITQLYIALKPYRP